MSSTTGKVINNTGVTLTFSDGSVSHGQNPSLLTTTLDNNNTADVFIAHSDGAGVEGTVHASHGGQPSLLFKLIYDNPVVGSNSGSVNAPEGYQGSASVGSGDNNTITYTLSVA